MPSAGPSLCPGVPVGEGRVTTHLPWGAVVWGTPHSGRLLLFLPLPAPTPGSRASPLPARSVSRACCRPGSAEVDVNWGCFPGSRPLAVYALEGPLPAADLPAPLAPRGQGARGGLLLPPEGPALMHTEAVLTASPESW